MEKYGEEPLDSFLLRKWMAIRSRSSRIAASMKFVKVFL